jgi:hypothetical protein
MSCCATPNDPAPANAAPTPAASGTPGGAGSDAAGGAGTTPPALPSVPAPGAVAPCVTCEITSETVRTQPPDRARTDIGVGERVRVTFSLGEADWTLAGGGNLSSDTGATIVYRAPSTAQSVTLTATGGGCTANKTFNIIAPTGVRMRRRDTLHRINCVLIGMHTDLFILPDTVNFHAIDVRELDSALAASGVFAPLGAIGHISGVVPPGGPGGAASATTTVRPEFGTKIDGIDTIFLGFYSATPTGPAAAVGRGSWTIPWQYALHGGTFRRFETLHQVQTCNAAGALAASKARALASANVTTASSGTVNVGGTNVVL